MCTQEVVSTYLGIIWTWIGLPLATSMESRCSSRPFLQHKSLPTNTF